MDASLSSSLVIQESEKGGMSVQDQELETKKELGIEDERFDEIKKIFGFFDEKNTGSITCHDLGFVLRGLGFNVTEKKVSDVINEHDRDGDGLIDFPEFINILKKHDFNGPELLEKDVISHFAVFDRKKDGHIDQMDFIEILTQMEDTEVFTKEDVDALWKEVKVNGDRRINYIEFTNHMFDTSRPPIGLSPWIDDEEKYANPEAHATKTGKLLSSSTR
mmetsp:Transcript_4152/g.8277  ORF Transcript_4152/g.8277 Transcript_4152/m.8277 type:complete len:219 (+) Transcript_4152:33-689(+)